MIGKLRIRLIMACMLSLLIVLAIIVGIINITNYTGIIQDADSVLTLLRQSGGQFPDIAEDVNWTEAGPRFQSPELAFETRFFSALMTKEGEILSTNVSRIAAVDSESVSEYAQEAFRMRQKSGFAGIYRYMRYEEGEDIRILFLDCGRILAGYRSVLLNSIVISLTGLTAVFLLILLLSRRIVRPVSDSYEKQKSFITDAGHEIKTPLTIIDADAELLEMEVGENEWLKDIRTQARRLTELTNSLICLSRMEESKRIHMIEFPVSDLAHEVALSFQSLAITQGKTFNVNIQPMLSICGDEKSIGQLISLLLDNALKYSSDHGLIQLTLEKTGRMIVLTVRNTVDSITPQTIDSMFDRFYRGDPARNSNMPGFGIGLSIAKAIASAHKAKIRASSPDGCSVLITVSFPA